MWFAPGDVESYDQSDGDFDPAELGTGQAGQDPAELVSAAEVLAGILAESSDTITRDGSTTGVSRMRENRGSVVSITGKEFGSQFDLTTAEGRRGYRKAAFDYYKGNVQGTVVKHPDERIRDVRFTRRGGEKAVNSSADVRKLMLFAKLPEILVSSEVIGDPLPVLHPENHKEVFQFWWLETHVELEGETYRVGFNLEERINGKIYYNHLLTDFLKKEGSPSGISEATPKSPTQPHRREPSNVIVPEPEGAVNRTRKLAEIPPRRGGDEKGDMASDGEAAPEAKGGEFLFHSFGSPPIPPAVPI